MRTILTTFINLGEWVGSWPQRTRLWVALFAFALLALSSLYKLVAAINKLEEPKPPASTEEMIGPMQKLFERRIQYKPIKKDASMQRLDSLAKQYINPKK